MAEEKVTTKSLEGKELPPAITWKFVEPRHYARAQERKKAGKKAYVDYVISLVERFDDRLVGVPGLYGELPVGAVELSKEQVEQVVKDFEAKFGGEDGD